MAQEPLASKGNFLHIYDFRVQAGQEAEFIRLFEEFDYSDGNPMHKSAAQVKDGVLCRDTEDHSDFSSSPSGRTSRSTPASAASWRTRSSPSSFA